MIVGFQAEHTLGKRLVERRDEVRIFGQPYQRKAEVAVLNYFSAHADEPGLVDFVGQFDRERLQRIFLVHGDLDRQEKMRAAFEADGHRHIAIPERGESVEL
jgi:metallo-beta-lactamase family protein